MSCDASRSWLGHACVVVAPSSFRAVRAIAMRDLVRARQAAVHSLRRCLGLAEAGCGAVAPRPVSAD